MDKWARRWHDGNNCHGAEQKKKMSFWGLWDDNQRGNKKIMRNKWQRKHNNPKHIGCSKSSSKKEVYSNTILPQEKTSNKQPNLTSKATKESMNETKS